jgi:hypothetical protein
MGRGGYIPPSGPLRFVSLFANIFCVRDFLLSFSPLLLFYCSSVKVVSPLRLFVRSSVRVVRLFGRGIRILCFLGGSPVFFFRKLFRVRTLRLFGVRVRSGCALVGYFSGGGIRILFFIGGSPVSLFANIFRVRGFSGGLGCRLR